MLQLIQGMGCEGAMSVRAARFQMCDVRSHFCTLFAHFLHQNGQKKLPFVLIKNYSRIFYPILEHPFLL
jgi:hypothetical protein